MEQTEAEGAPCPTAAPATTPGKSETKMNPKKGNQNQYPKVK